MGWHEHWYRFSQNPHNPKPGRVVAPPSPDTDPVPLPGHSNVSESTVGYPAHDLTAVDRLAQRIDADLERNTGPLPQDLGASAVEHVADLGMTVADLEMLATRPLSTTSY